jgi:hypothetical protein
MPFVALPLLPLFIDIKSAAMLLSMHVRFTPKYAGSHA